MSARWSVAAGLWLGLLATACGAQPIGSVPDNPPLAPGTTLPAALPEVPPPAALPLTGLAYEAVATGLEEPTWVAAPDGDDRIFVLQKTGAVRVIIDGELQDEPYLDLEPFVGSDATEQGLIGLAFHPRFGENGRFFVYYTNRIGDSRVVEFSGSADPGKASGTEGQVILSVAQPHKWHNGGMLEFGPDGYLWLSLGDGGGIGDQFDQGQRPETLLGTIVRMDVNSDSTYEIPPDNPFVNGGGAAEVWAYGLRNPYRFSFDKAARLIYIGDVGQEEWEEIDVISIDDPGQNFGWSVREGTECYEANSCDSGFTEPVLTYSHRAGCAVIAGPVYFGADLPELFGHFFYSDYCAGFMRSFRFDAGGLVDEQSWTDDLGKPGRITSIGVDGSGELVVTTQDGDVLRVVAVRD